MADVKDGKIEVPCPDCGQLSLEPISRLCENDVIPCSICGGLMDLNAENCRPVVAQAKVIASGIR